MYTSIKSFVLKLDIFSFHVQNNNFISFPCCDELKKEPILINFQASVDEIVQVIYLLKDDLISDSPILIRKQKIYSRLRLIGSLWFQSILTRLSGI